MSSHPSASRRSVDLSPFFLTHDALDGPIDWAEFFGNQNPVELEIGCGRGLFLVTAGTANPDVNYFGLELDYKEARRAARRLCKRNLQNVRILGGDARPALDRFIGPASVSVVHVYFPDPWWKRRHKKRRLFTDALVEQISRILKPGGLVHSWTDVEEYYTVISALMDHHERFTNCEPPGERPAEHDMDYQTSFERKKRKAGLPIYRGKWRRAEF